MLRLQPAGCAFSSRSIVRSVPLLLEGVLLISCDEPLRPDRLVLSAPASLVAGRVAQATVLGAYPDGSTRDRTAAVTWTSDTPAIVAISDAVQSKGRIRAVSVGATHIRAALDGQSADAEVFVAQAELDSVSISPLTTSLAKGTTLRLAASGIYSDASVRDVTQKVLWISQDPNVATVSNLEDPVGLLTAQGEGIATIMAAWFSVRASTQIEVGPPRLVSLSIAAPSTTLRVGSTLQLAVASAYSDRSTPDVSPIVTWSSSNPAVLAVSNEEGTRGLAVARDVGQVQITATLEGAADALNLRVEP